jgi:magnesium-transporting ATPase (P-type)
MKASYKVLIEHISMATEFELKD